MHIDMKDIITFLVSTLLLLFMAATVASFSFLPKSYKTVEVTKGEAVEAVYATAVVEPITWAAIAPIKTGRIAEVNVNEGDIVNTGDVLARLDDADYRAQLKEEEELASYYRNNLVRSKKLLDSGYDSSEKYEARQMELIRSEARISMMKEQIRQLALVAPMDGTVLWRDIELGEVKQAGDPLFWVGQPRPLRLEAEVDEEDIPKIKDGQSVLITADAFPGEVMEGLVHWVSPKGDPVNKSYRMYVTLPENTKLMIGMTVETNTIVQEKSDALLVPTEAVIEGPAVWIPVQVDKKTLAKKIQIKIGVRGEDNTEILGGLSEGDRILLPPFDGLQEGAKIRAK